MAEKTALNMSAKHFKRNGAWASFPVSAMAALSLAALGSEVAQADVIYAKADATGANNGSNWVDAYTELQAALTAANPSDEIWVAAGTYKPDFDVAGGTHTGDRDLRFELANDVEIYGGFNGTETARAQRNPDPETNGTILSGDLTGNDVGGLNDPSRAENSYNVVLAENVSGAVLDGFTITAGNANGSAHPRDNGAGVHVDGGSPTISNCTFSGNSASQLGGGMSASVSDVVVTDCTFSGNAARILGGGAFLDFGGTLARCMFSGNSLFGEPPVVAHGGGLWAKDVSVTTCTFSGNSAARGGGAAASGTTRFLNCAFTGNSSSPRGGGLYIQGPGAALTLVNCTFSWNTSVVGGAVYDDASASAFVNCSFLGNAVTSARGDGGAVKAQDSSSSFVNCAFFGNSAEHDGGAVDDGGAPSTTFTDCTFALNWAQHWGGGLAGSDMTLANCILWQNFDITGQTQRGQIMSARATITYSCIQGLLAGGRYDDGTNIGDDPMFVNIFTGNLRLSAGSPCIDAGSNAALPPDTLDLDGDGNTSEPIPFDLDGRCRVIDGNADGTAVVDMGGYEFGVCPAYVDWQNQSGIENGSAQFPFNTFIEGIRTVFAGCGIVIRTGSYNETLLIDRPVGLITAENGPVIVGE